MGDRSAGGRRLEGAWSERLVLGVGGNARVGRGRESGLVAVHQDGSRSWEGGRGRGGVGSKLRFDDDPVNELLFWSVRPVLIARWRWRLGLTECRDCCAPSGELELD